ncbi:MAG: phospho-N-acetylmuramoyl-pentapeptide-transferase [Synechococcaceae cyanobacterium RL_1_2]|nr:phospho-N-acetylmuramoyl-pentapeptide-transferase [Synechococcaceae cyanobacterium RL_1_2]
MQLKFSSSVFVRPSGEALLMALGVSLLAIAIVADGQYSQSLLSLGSMTVPWLISALVTAGLGFLVVPILRKLKTGQVIQEDGPQTHLVKAGTPTMGGVFFVPVAIAVALIISGFSNDVFGASLITLVYFGVGLIDDWQVLKLKSNKGISPKMKMGLQFMGGIIFLLWLKLTHLDGAFTNVQLPGDWVIPCGILFWPLAMFILTAESNATNITDGVDGLAGGTAAIALLGLAIVLAPTNPDLMIFAASLSGACTGFVVHNRNKAKVFMGDTGSLAIGGALAGLGLISGQLWPLFILSLLFFIECLSVIAQVSYFKATKDANGQGKRLFKMAPIHHHIELSGWSETQIVGLFYLVNLALIPLALM